MLTPPLGVFMSALKAQPVETFDVVVVGSGFGGAVSAYRYAEAGLSVLLLERGKPYPPGSFPRTPREFSEAFWDPSKGLYGLFHIHFSKHLGAVMASGLGGGSLVYAGVTARPDEKTLAKLASRTGSGVLFDGLDQHFDRAEKRLAAMPVPFHLPGYEGVERMRAFDEAAARLGPSHRVTFQPAPLAMAFSDGKPLRQKFGDRHGNLHHAERYTCKLCAECIFGCNEGSKHSLDYTYLSDAARLGAEIRTLAEVRTLQPNLKGGGYLVGYLDHSNEQGPAMRHVVGKRLVLAAGAPNSVYLLMKNREHFKGLSPRLGEGFSGNGDLLAFVAMGKRSLRPEVGPVITSMLSNETFSIQDVGYPTFLMWLIAGMDSLSWGNRFSRAVLRRNFLPGKTNYGSELSRFLDSGTATDRSAPICSMGHETPNGRLFLDEEGRLELDWSRKDSEQYFRALRSAMADIAKAWGGRKVDLIDFFKNKMTTVHPIGGVPVGTDPSSGVVDGNGEVFGYPDFFVADGSLLSGTVGINPSLTIAALADRIAQRSIERRKAA